MWKFKNNKMQIKTKNPYSEIKPFIKKTSYSKLKPLIIVLNLQQSFGRGKNFKNIYNDISFEIYENERVAFLGPNGAGKTVTISTLCGIYKPKGGTINYLFDYETKPYEKLSVQFQDLQFPNSLTPRDLIKFSLGFANINEMNIEIKKALKVFEIDQIIDTKISKLSGGQQQRVNVFMALISKPKILFLDEFTTGLDIAIKNNIQNFILEYCKKHKITLVVISHDIDSIEDMCDRIIILADKKIIMDAPCNEIIKKFGSVKKMLKAYILV